VFAPDWRRISSTTVGTPSRRASERCSSVPSSASPIADADRHAVARRDDEVVEGFGSTDAPHRAHRALAPRR
jgi:hypothetical protein